MKYVVNGKNYKYRFKIIKPMIPNELEVIDNSKYLRTQVEFLRELYPNGLIPSREVVK